MCNDPNADSSMRGRAPAPGQSHFTARSARLLQPLAHQLRKVFHRQRAVVEHGLVITPQLELVSLFALHRLAQLVERSPANKVGRKLAGTLLRPDDLAGRL